MCPAFSGDQKRVMFRWEGTLPVSLPVLWPCTSPICFHKTTKDPHGPFKKDWDTHSDLFGHVDYWQNKGRDYSSTRYGHSFTSVPGMCYKLAKVSDDTSSRDRISGNGHFLSIEKITVKKQVSGSVSESRDNSFRGNKVVRSPDITVLAILPAKLHCRFLQQQQIQTRMKNTSYKSEVLQNKESQMELFWWVKNIEIYNGRTLIQLSPQALLQTDTSLTGWGGQSGKE